MKSFYLAFYVSATWISRVSSIPTPGEGGSVLKTIHQFPNYTWIENMAIRSNGQILANDLSSGQIYLVNPQEYQVAPPVIAQFPNGTAITGIAEIEEDVFYTQSVQGNAYEVKFVPNTTVIWEVDIRGYRKGGQASLRKVVEIPAANLPNGMTLLNKQDGTILIADSVLGVVWRVNVYTGAYEIVLDDSLLKPVPGSTFLFGVNGVHVVDDILYFSNTNQAILAKVPISRNGLPTGPIVTITKSVPAADDFTVDRSGNIWLAENVENTFVRVSTDGQVQTIVGGVNSTALIGPVATAFGRGRDDRDILYISTDGLTENSNGMILTSNGKIASIDTNCWR
ncbi:hypothetical protein BGW36DRAFT_437822 [Talaromyces proteolyticus]|uniref:SMP-30/Gluconolactonase/LRE-like region domain-containing protein n=1 Tax=Talaromyces proteolyticus TaxID=1131652 RepID=A0AAD4KII2_9EURO|nr:uncharacterized protein BGW36DRAFT_437822 [Talaromyces proteolyticus]KAH8692017.1 hypothetical protein BGW36DRAFT_437822 [Talaromyces proteolyticus]